MIFKRKCNKMTEEYHSLIKKGMLKNTDINYHVFKKIFYAGYRLGRYNKKRVIK